MRAGVAGKSSTLLLLLVVSFIAGASSESAEMAEQAQLQGILKWSLAQSDGFDPSKAREISEEEREWFLEAMRANTQDPTEYGRELAKEIARDPSGELTPEQVELREEVLEALQEHVESIDHANDLSAIGGFDPLLATLRSPHPSLRAGAAAVLGTVVQNNPKAQELAMEKGTLALLHPLLQPASEPKASVRNKALFATSCLVRNNAAGVAAFRTAGGAGVLATATGSVEEDARGARRAMLLAQHLVTHDEAFLDASVEAGLVSATAIALRHAMSDQEAQSQDGALVREAALSLLNALAAHCDFERFPGAIEEFRGDALVGSLKALQAKHAALDRSAAEPLEEEIASTEALLRMLG